MRRLLPFKPIALLAILTLAAVWRPATADTAWDTHETRRAAYLEAMRALAENLAATAGDPRLAGIESIAVLPVAGLHRNSPRAGDLTADLTAELRNLLANTPFRVYDRVDYEQLYGETVLREDFTDLFAPGDSAALDSPGDRIDPLPAASAPDSPAYPAPSSIPSGRAMPVQAYLRAEVLTDRATALGGHTVELTWNLSDVATWNVLAGNTARGTARSPWWPAGIVAGGMALVALLGAGALAQMRDDKKQARDAKARAERLRERAARDAIAAEALRATHSLRDALRQTGNPALLYRLRAGQVALDALRREVETAYPLHGPRAEAARDLIRWQRNFHTALTEIAARARAIAESIAAAHVSDLENQLDSLHCDVKRLREQWQGRAERLTALAA